MTSRFLINDGQHTRVAIAEAIKMNPALKNEHISVVFYRGEGLLRFQQIFSDLNRYAIKPTKSINILFNFQEESSIIAKRIIEEVDNLRAWLKRSEQQFPIDLRRCLLSVRYVRQPLIGEKQTPIGKILYLLMDELQPTGQLRRPCQII